MTMVIHLLDSFGPAHTTDFSYRNDKHTTILGLIQDCLREDFFFFVWSS